MLKLIGAFMVIFGCSNIGFYYRRELREGLHHMRILRQILEMMMREIRYNKSTLPECCRQVGKNVEEPYDEVLAQIYRLMSSQSGYCFSECWQQEMGKCLSGLPISGKEKQMALGLASCGSLNDCDMQIRAIEQYRDMIECAVRRREETLHRQGKMAAGLGIMSGLLLVVILI